jgi:hypothetical protein
LVFERIVMSSLAGVRSRWAAIGAACAVALGAGGFGVVNAVVSSGEKSVFVPVSPIRVLDTRDSAEITNGTRRLVVEGQITLADGSSSVVVPSAASAVAVNVTATATRKNGGYGFVTVFPCVSDGDGVPNASSLNFETGVDIANALSVSTSANGSICLYVYGTADLIVDVAGYYVDHDHDDRYYTEAEVDAALAGKADLSNLRDSSVTYGSSLVDADLSRGAWSSIAIGSNGYPIVSYLDNTTKDLRIAACNDSSCTDATISVIDGEGEVSQTSIAIGVDGNPIVGFYEMTGRDLKVVACTNARCTAHLPPRTVDSTGEVGSQLFLAIGSNGNPIISYLDSTPNYDLKIVACTTPTCSTNNPPLTVDSGVESGRDSAIAIGVNGIPIISYLDGTNGDLKVVSCTTGSCSGVNAPITLDSAGLTGFQTSIIIGIHGYPIISYHDGTNGDLKVISCTSRDCSTALPPVTIDSAGVVGWDTSMAVGPNGNPVISYMGFAGGLKLAVCTDYVCSSAVVSELDTDAAVGFFSSVAIGMDGRPVVSYYVQSPLARAGLRVVVPWWASGSR